MSEISNNNSSEEDTKKCLGLCFLIYDRINHEELWNNWLKNVDEDKYKIFIHYKNNKELKYFEKYKLNNCIKTNYTDYTIPLAYNLLFREAYKNNNIYKFIILSGACIPLKSFDYIYDKLIADTYGYFNICRPEQCFPWCNSLKPHIDNSLISKSHNWFILNRILVENLCSVENDQNLIKYYRRVYAPAEYYYYTFIKINKLENEIKTTNTLASGATTFTNWKGMNYPFPNEPLRSRAARSGRPHAYNIICKEEIDYLLEQPCLFGRKFNEDCKILNENFSMSKYLENKICKIN